MTTPNISDRARAETAERERDEYAKEFVRIQALIDTATPASAVWQIKNIISEVQPTRKEGDESCAPTNSSTDSGTQSQAASDAAPTGPTPSDAATPTYWIIVYEDRDHPNEVFTDEMAARATLHARIGSWSCHLFVSERELTAERAKSAELANSFGAELTAIQSLLVEELIASRDERVARLKAEEERDKAQSAQRHLGEILKHEREGNLQFCRMAEKAERERDSLRTELAKRPTYGALVAENKALRAEIETMFSRRELLAKIDRMQEAIEATGMALEDALGNYPEFLRKRDIALDLLAPWRPKPEDLPRAAKV